MEARASARHDERTSTTGVLVASGKGLVTFSPHPQKCARLQIEREDAEAHAELFSRLHWAVDTKRCVSIEGSQGRLTTLALKSTFIGARKLNGWTKFAKQKEGTERTPFLPISVRQFYFIPGAEHLPVSWRLLQLPGEDNYLWLVKPFSDQDAFEVTFDKKQSRKRRSRIAKVHEEHNEKHAPSIMDQIDQKVGELQPHMQYLSRALNDTYLELVELVRKALDKS